MEIRTLRYFLAVIDHGSASAASRVVHVAQPSLSRQLHSLERSLGVELFHKRRGSLRLTVAGERFLPMARDIVARADRARTILSHFADGTDVPLTLVAPPTTVADVVAPYLADEWPLMGLQDIVECDPRAVYDLVQRGDADVGISTLPPPGSMDTRVVGQAPVCALAPSGDPVAALTEIDIADLVKERLILMRRNNAARLTLDAAAAARGLSYLDPHVVSVTSVAQALASSGHGIAVLTDQPLFGLTVIPIRVPDGILSVTLYAGWDSNHFAASGAASLVESIINYHRTLPALS